MSKRLDQKGFTLIELMIASMVFSIVLILCVTAMIQIARTYYKGVTTSRTQEAARSILDGVAQAIQFSSSSVILPDVLNPNRYCIDNRQYTFVLGQQLEDNITEPADEARRVLVRAQNGGCPPATPLGGEDVAINPSAWRELVPKGMRLSNFSITRNTPTGLLYTITVRVVSGDSVLLCSPALNNCNSIVTMTEADIRAARDLSCKKDFGGTAQFCAVSELSTVVQKRL